MPTMEGPESGRLLAVSIGEPRDIAWRGETIRTGIFKSPVEGPVWVGTTGLEGDGQADLDVHGGIDKAVYAFDDSSTAYWREALDRADLRPGVFGENLSLSGWPEAEVRIGDRFRIGEVELQVSQPRQPCSKLGMRFDDPSLPRRFFASGRVGYYLRVLEPGRVRAGDEVIRTETDVHRLDVQSLVSIWLDRSADTAALERAIGLEALADAWREPLRKRLEKGSTVSP